MPKLREHLEELFDEIVKTGKQALEDAATAAAAAAAASASASEAAEPAAAAAETGAATSTSEDDGLRGTTGTKRTHDESADTSQPEDADGQDPDVPHPSKRHATASSSDHPNLVN